MRWRQLLLQQLLLLVTITSPVAARPSRPTGGQLRWAWMIVLGCMRWILCAVLALALAGCGAGKRPDKETIGNLFNQWNAALATGDPNQVADLYAEDAVLLATVSNQLRTNRTEILDYFTDFLPLKPQGTITDSLIFILDRDTAVNTGTYQFTFAEGGPVDARYTYVYEFRRGKWLIINHHSSAMPE